MRLDLQPPQPPSVERVVELLLEERSRPDVDPWWHAGLVEALAEPEELD
jgi:hypothetical protein